MKRVNALLQLASQPSRVTALAVPRRQALLNVAEGPTRRQALMNQYRRRTLSPTMAVQYKDSRGRQFHVTRSGAYVIPLGNGRLAYGRKAYFNRNGRISNYSRVPTRLRPKAR